MLQCLPRTLLDGGQEYTEVIACPVMEPRRLNALSEEQGARRNKPLLLFEAHSVVLIFLGIIHAA